MERLTDSDLNVLEMVKVLLFGLIIGLILRTFVFNFTLVSGQSMYPTLHNNDKLMVNKISPMLSGYNRGDIVILDSPKDKNIYYIKRIIGIEGDIIEIKNGKIFLNNEELIEDYIEENSYTDIYNQSKWEIPKDYVFVLGDNRLNGASLDSRLLGFIHTSSLKGVAKLRIFPFSSSGTLK